MLATLYQFVETHLYEFLEFYGPWLMISIGTIVFLVEAIGGVRAEYGRYNKKNMGFSAPVAWFLQESPAFLVPFGLWLYRGPSIFDKTTGSLNTNLIVLSYFLIHYFNRSFIYTLRIKSSKKVNFMENGLAFIFCMVNGSQIGHYHTYISGNALSTWNFWLGTGLFFFGLWVNIDSDNRLLRLRKDSKAKDDYKVPVGGFFEYVSAANYFGECVEWMGFALASWSLPALAFSLFTWSNIGPRGYHHHEFYLQKFGNKYPKNRKAIIPFLI